MAAALKDLYTPAFLEEVAGAFHAVHPAFRPAAFLEAVLGPPWEALELKQRMGRIAEALHEALALPFHEAAPVLGAAAARLGSGYLYMFFPAYVEQYGQQHWALSVAALEELTQYSSSEFAVRPLILRDPERMMAQMRRWADHPSEHVRRLASEGCRPRLPWAIALKDFQRDPAPILPILEALREDDSEYVRRSVANNLNDIAKDHPQLVLGLARQWLGNHPATDRLLKHACRTLLKRGDPGALALFGFEQEIPCQALAFRAFPAALRIGESASFEAELLPEGEGEQRLRLEYAIHFVRQQGSSVKVFQIREGLFPAGQPLRVQFRHSFRDLSTRRHYPGLHEVALRVNGSEAARAAIQLLPEA